MPNPAPTEESRTTVTPSPEPTEEPRTTVTPSPAPTEESRATATPSPTPTEEPQVTAPPTPIVESEATATPVPVEHVHHYVNTRQEPGCESEGLSYDVCEGCGDICNQENIPALGHDYEKRYIWGNPPTCSSASNYNLVCARCKEIEGTYTDPALPHTPVEVSRVDATCSSLGAKKMECSVCGWDLGYETFLDPDKHDFKEFKRSYWSEESGEMLYEIVVKCQWCGKEPD